MISDLAKYDPSAWQENGVIKPLPKSPPKQNTPRRDAIQMIGAVMLSLACVANTVDSLSLTIADNTSEINMAADGRTDTSETEAELLVGGDYISPKAWPALMKSLEGLPELEEVEGLDPETFF